MNYYKRLPLLAKVIIAIALGIVCSTFFPQLLTEIFATIGGIFGNFLGFVIPLIIFGLVAPGIAELGKGAGKLLGITVAIAYISTVAAGYFSYFTCALSYPKILDPSTGFASIENINAIKIEPLFSIDMPPVMGVTTSLILAFIIGLGLTALNGNSLKQGLFEFRELVTAVITKIIIPLLPLYIFCLFLEIGAEGQVKMVLGLFLKVIAIIFVMHIVLLLAQFGIAGAVSKKNPITALKNMLPAYLTALGTQSSAATIPVTLAQAKKNGVNPGLADFVIPLCATIHLSGSQLKIVACAFAISFMSGTDISLATYSGFIFMLAITMVAAPGVPGGAIMAALGLLSSMLGFNDNLLGLMIALYITMDSFGTACNVTGDGAIALMVDKIYKGKA